MQVPFLDLRAQYESIKAEIAGAVNEVLESSAFAGGPFVEKFEREFARFCHCRHAIGVGSGTEALWLSLLALGIGPGDEVITVPNTFIATAEAISFCGAKPLFVDIDEETYTLDPQRLHDFLKTRHNGNGRIKAVIPVHLYGQMADMDAIRQIAAENDLHLIEDACQAHGARYRGMPAGSIGEAGCFSFYPGKNLGAFGEAGAVVTNNRELADRIRVLRDHGQQRKYLHSVVGWNARMDGLQGAILELKLKHLDTWNGKRKEHAAHYDRLLAGQDGIVLPKVRADAGHVYHLYVIRTAKRDQFVADLSARGIQCGIHYPVPIHLQEAYRFLGLPEHSLPVAEKCCREVMSLPMYAELTEEHIHYVVNQLTDLLRHAGKGS